MQTTLWHSDHMATNYRGSHNPALFGLTSRFDDKFLATA